MGNSYALLIGINKYSRLEKKYELAGCVSDAQLMKSVLTGGFGFAEQHIVELHDAEASRDNILAAMHDLVEKAGNEDRVYFHFSGHGSYRKCADGTEASGYDSTIMPADSGRDPDPDLDIQDDEIGGWLEALSKKTSNITAVFDCCHSGTISRDPFAPTPRAGPPDMRAPEDMALPPKMFSSGTRGIQGGGLVPGSEHYVVISGCRDNEKSNEWPQIKNGTEIRHGALTYYLSEALLAARPGTTYEEIFERASRQVTDIFAEQHPQIEGRQDRVLFGVESVTPMKYFLLNKVENDTVTLAGGAAHGVVAGSRWRVYPPGTASKGQAEPLAAIEVTELQALTATASVVESSGSIEPGCRCTLESSPSEFPPLLVDIDALPEDCLQSVAQGIAASALLQRADSPALADARLIASDTGWTLSGKDGLPVAPTHTLDSDEDIRRLLGNMEVRARARNVVALENPDSSIAVEFKLYHSSDGREWSDANQGAVFNYGDIYGIEIINNDERDLFVTLIDIDVTGEVTSFYPPGARRASELLEKKKSVKINFQTKQGMGLADDFYRDSGRETFKAVISTAESNFSWLEQGATRSLGGFSNPASQLEDLFQRASGSGTRGRLANNTAGEDWITINRSFEVKKKG